MDRNIRKGKEGEGKRRGREGKGREGKEGEGKGREGKGRKGKGREGKGKEGKGKQGKGREGYLHEAEGKGGPKPRTPDTQATEEKEIQREDRHQQGNSSSATSSRWKPVSLRTLWKLSSSENVKTELAGFPGGAVVENLLANAGNMGSSPGLGRSHMPRSN